MKRKRTKFIQSKDPSSLVFNMHTLTI